MFNALSFCYMYPHQFRTVMIRYFEWISHIQAASGDFGGSKRDFFFAVVPVTQVANKEEQHLQQ